MFVISWAIRPLGYESYRLQGLNAKALRAESPKVCATINSLLSIVL